VSVGYKAVQWNPHKRVYDLVIVGSIAAYLAVFMAAGMLLFPAPGNISPEVLAIRALGTLAIVMLHVILAIGPLARIDARFAVLLYNRRHLGVSFFLVALGHALLATMYYGFFGGVNPLGASLAYGAGFRAVSDWPFEVFGFLALLIFFLMAATSHDFWLANLSPRWWKWLHMGVYVAYALVVLHVSLGALQSEVSPVYAVLLLGGVVLISGLHLAAGWKQVLGERRSAVVPRESDGWVDAGLAAEIPESRARVVCLRGGESVAVFNDGGAISAIANRCAHQGGPLSEGQIVDGCVTCPWHGYQYRARDGQSPPPFTEKVPTHEVRIEGGRVLVNPRALAPGTPVEPARIGRAKP